MSDPSKLRNAQLVQTLLMISKSIRAFNGLKLAELGIFSGQDELLMALSEKGTSIILVADLLAIRPSTVSKMLNRLEEGGLAERIADPRDGRRTLTRITPAGVEMRSRIAELHKELKAELVSGIEAERLTDIASSIEECEGILRAKLRRLR